MKEAPWIKQTRREFDRQKTRELREAVNALRKVLSGCAFTSFSKEVSEAYMLLRKAQRINKSSRNQPYANNEEKP